MVHGQMCTVTLWEEDMVCCISQMYLAKKPFFCMEHLAMLGFHR